MPKKPYPYSSMLFGLGPEADVALGAPLTTQSKVKILTCWINSRADIDGWFKSWVDGGALDQWWSKGYALHIITYGWGSNHASEGFVDAMDALAMLVSRADDKKHLILFSLASEFQTYAQPNNCYNDTTAAYYDDLMCYLRWAKAIIAEKAANARVSFCWGGWQARWDDPTNGGGLSMFQYFGDLMKEMDFMSFQLMQGDGNIGTPHDDMRGMMDAIKPYNKQLMMAHYKLDAPLGNATQAIFNQDITNLFKPSYMTSVNCKGLFAFSFMDSEYLADPTALQTAIKGINKYTSL